MNIKKPIRSKLLLSTLACMLLTVVAYMPLLAQHNNIHDINPTALGKRVEYDLYIDHLMVNYTGKEKMGMAINRGKPGPGATLQRGRTDRFKY